MKKRGRKELSTKRLTYFYRERHNNQNYRNKTHILNSWQKINRLKKRCRNKMELFCFQLSEQ